MFDRLSSWLERRERERVEHFHRNVMAHLLRSGSINSEEARRIERERGSTGQIMTDAYRISELEAKVAELRARQVELEDALIHSLGGDAHDGIFHLFHGDCPDDNDGTEWQRDPSCPACKRLEALIGHRRPAK